MTKPLIEEIQELVGKRGYIVSDVEFEDGKERLVLGIKEDKKAPRKVDPRQMDLWEHVR